MQYVQFDQVGGRLDRLSDGLEEARKFADAIRTLKDASRASRAVQDDQLPRNSRIGVETRPQRTDMFT